METNREVYLSTFALIVVQGYLLGGIALIAVLLSKADLWVGLIAAVMYAIPILALIVAGSRMNKAYDEYVNKARRNRT